MTALPLPFTRRTTPALPINHGAYYCGMCWTPPGVEHELSCDEVTPEQAAAFLRRPRLAYPAEARIFRGLPIGVALGVAIYAAIFALIGAIA